MDSLAEKYPSWSPYNYVLNNPLGMVDLFGLEPCKNWDVKTQGYCEEVVVEAVGFSHERRGRINSIAFDLHEQRQPSWGWSSPPSSTDYLLAWKLWVSENITDPYIRELVEAGEIPDPEGLVEDDTLPFMLAGGALGVAQRLAQRGSAAALDDVIRYADEMQSVASRSRANTVASLKVKKGSIFRGRNGQSPTEKELIDVLDGIPPTERSIYHGGCAEMNCINNALVAKKNPQGGTISVRNVRGRKSLKHNTHKSPCESCQAVLDYYNIKVKQ